MSMKLLPTILMDMKIEEIQDGMNNLLKSIHVISKMILLMNLNNF